VAAVQAYNKAIKFVPAFGLHRTPFPGRRLLLALGSLRKFLSGWFTRNTASPISTLVIGIIKRNWFMPSNVTNNLPRSPSSLAASAFSFLDLSI